MDYSLTFSAAGWHYTRQVLGMRPHDEVRPLIAQLEGQAAQQDQAQHDATGPHLAGNGHDSATELQGVSQ